MKMTHHFAISWLLRTRIWGGAPAARVWAALQEDGPFYHECMSSATHGMALHSGCKTVMGDVEAIRCCDYTEPKPGRSWLR
eukprot:6472604-Karenia_brevis.AAC.1